jgi:serine/threonine-protein kinase RsbW
MSTELEVRLGNDFAELPKLIQAAEAFLLEHKVPEGTSFKSHLALEEMCTNIIKYGYDDAGKHEIIVRFSWTPEFVTVQFEDDGHEFDPVAQEAPDVDKPLAERKIGGLGIHLVRHSVDSMEYRRRDGRNVLTIKLRCAA